jgi:hypothetical protein
LQTLFIDLQLWTKRPPAQNFDNGYKITSRHFSFFPVQLFGIHARDAKLIAQLTCCDFGMPGFFFECALEKNGPKHKQS